MSTYQHRTSLHCMPHRDSWIVDTHTQPGGRMGVFKRTSKRQN